MERITKYQKPDAYKAEQKAKKQARADAIRQANTDTFLAAHERAKECGMVLKRFTGGHFQLLKRSEGWLIDIWPLQRRIVPKGNAPKVIVDYGWTLLNIVESICGGQETG